MPPTALPAGSRSRKKRLTAGAAVMGQRQADCCTFRDILQADAKAQCQCTADASGSPVNASAAARPATIPSGRLCNVTASTIRPPCPVPPASSCPANCSTCKRPTAPSTSPTADGIHAGSGKVCPRWIAGSSRLHTLAASMMPAAMPHRMRCVQGRDRRRSKNTPAAPSVVHAAGTAAPTQ